MNRKKRFQGFRHFQSPTSKTLRSFRPALIFLFFCILYCVWRQWHRPFGSSYPTHCLNTPQEIPEKMVNPKAH